MTQDDFFGAIENNLQQLAREHGLLPSYNLPTLGSVAGRFEKLKWISRVKSFRCVSKGDSCCPPNVRCYDLISSKVPFYGRIAFRVFACYADESTRDGYCMAKRAIRRWYNESGRATSSDQPYAAAIVVGASSPWEPGLTPNADDMPCANVAFRMLAASHPQPEMGICTAKEGDVESCITVCRALVPETFDKVERRVRDCVNRLFLPYGGVCGGGFVTVRRVRDELPMLPFEVVANIFNKMQAEGTHSIGKRKADVDRESRMYIENRPPSWWRKMLSRGEGEWYTQSKLCRAVSLGTLASLLALPWSFVEKMVPDLVFAHRWVFLSVCCGLLGLCLILWLLGFLRRRM